MNWKEWLAGMLLLLVSGCASYPLGMTEEQWLALSPQHQFEARLKQAELDQLRDERLAAEHKARQEEARLQQAQLEMARQQAVYGERVQCVLDKAELRLLKKWRPLQPLAIDVVAGQAPHKVDFVTRDGRYSQGQYVSFDGQTLTICRQQDSRRQDCGALVATFNDYHRGIQQRLELEKSWFGDLRCQFVPKIWR